LRCSHFSGGPVDTDHPFEVVIAADVDAARGAEMHLARENIRATQILEEKMEVVRLFNWDQVVNLPGYIPTNFIAPFYANNPTNPPAGSFNYTGAVLVTSSLLPRSKVPAPSIVNAPSATPIARALSLPVQRESRTGAPRDRGGTHTVHAQH
jgi:hypothetical protein